MGGYGLSFGDTSSGVNANSLNNGTYSHHGKTNYDHKYQIHNIEEDADEVIETTEGKEQMTEGKRPSRYSKKQNNRLETLNETYSNESREKKIRTPIKKRPKVGINQPKESSYIRPK